MESKTTAKILTLHRGNKNNVFTELEPFYNEMNRLLSTAPENATEPVSAYIVNIFNETVQKIVDHDTYCSKYLVPKDLPICWIELSLAGRALQAYLKEKYKS
jgi:hypothetical protein